MPLKAYRRYGYVPDLPDGANDKYYKAPHIEKLPTSIDLTAGFPFPPCDQESLGSCSSCAFAGMLEYLRKKEHMADMMPSRLFIYYNERAQMRTINSDSGSSLKNGIQVLSKQGYCDEKDWPYIINQFTRKPLTACYKEAQQHLILSWQRIPRDLLQMKGCLADGFPFALGFSVYPSTEQAMEGDGNVQLPQDGEELLGGHAVLCVGFDDMTSTFLVRNSWGTGCGLKDKPGHFKIPYGYFTDANLSDDFWTIRLVY